MNAHSGWRLGCQAYSFRHLSFFETIDRNASLGLTAIEAYPTQRLSPEDPSIRFDHHAPPDVLAAVRAKLDSAGVALSSYGVVDLPDDEAACRRVFDFARAMGIEIVVSEPPLEAMPLVDRLCGEYGIRMAIHNHPAPSRYWNPDTVLEACRGRSALVGACADTGHWVRSGVDPLKALRKLEGRIVSLHLKDVDVSGADARDVPWGVGVGEIPALLEELRHQNIRPLVSIEYVLPDGEDPQADIARCVAYFRAEADVRPGC